jgi:hypothetical protein
MPCSWLHCLRDPSPFLHLGHHKKVFLAAGGINDFILNQQCHARNVRGMSLLTSATLLSPPEDFYFHAAIRQLVPQ